MKLDEKPGRRPGHADASAAVTAALATARFPATRESLVKDVGTWKVQLGPGQTATLGDILRAIPEDSFRTTADAQNRIDAHWDRVVADLQGGGAGQGTPTRKASSQRGD